MKHLSIVYAAALAVALSACSGDDFEAQAENAVRQEMLTGMQHMEALAGARFADHGLTDMDRENFRTSDCRDEGAQRTCKVSFQVTATVNGEKEVMDESAEGGAVFEKQGDQWLLVEMD